MSNAHANSTPHHVGQTDQPRLAKSRVLVADAFERDRAAATKPDPHDLATWILEQLQALGWKSPPDPAADIPPLRPDRAATEDSPGRLEFRAGLCDRFGHTAPDGTCPRCGEVLAQRNSRPV